MTDLFPNRSMLPPLKHAHVNAVGSTRRLRGQRYSHRIQGQSPILPEAPRTTITASQLIIKYKRQLENYTYIIWQRLTGRLLQHNFVMQESYSPM